MVVEGRGCVGGLTWASRSLFDSILLDFSEQRLVIRIRLRRVERDRIDHGILAAEQLA